MDFWWPAGHQGRGFDDPLDQPAPFSSAFWRLSGVVREEDGQSCGSGLVCFNFRRVLAQTGGNDGNVTR